MASHAFLLIVHKNPLQVLKLLRTLDDERNVVIVHCDKKMSEVDFKAISAAKMRYAEFEVLQYFDVLWGSYTQIETELLLLREALGRGCSYYHLLSGECLPLRTQDEIHAFFDASGQEFIAFNPQFEWGPTLNARLREHHFQNRNSSVMAKALDKAWVIAQRIARKNYLDPDVCYGYGSNWFSVTDSFACDLIEHEGWVREHFGLGLCADEVFLQSFALTFGYRDRLYKPFDAGDKWGNVRLVDWDRGEGIHPYTLCCKDYDWAMGTGMMFGRKFSDDVDVDMVNRVVEAVSRTGVINVL